MAQVAEFKQAARATWGSGDYDAFLRKENFYQLGERLVRQAGVRPEDKVLDVACGTGNVAIPAAQAGAAVTGLDLTPAMLAVARQRAAAAGVAVEWVEGDAEELPFEDASFDVVLSAFGCMFAPRHEVVAGEIVRVLRPGGRIGIYSWVPDGPIGDFFRVAGAYLPPLPESASPPLHWGDPEQVRKLFAGTGVQLDLIRETFMIRYDSVADAVDWYTTEFGPVRQARVLAEASGHDQQLRAELTELFTRSNRSGGTRLEYPAEYLVVRGRVGG